MAFMGEIADYLAANGLGTVGTTILRGAQSKIPAGDGPFLVLIETGGTGSTRTHNNPRETTRPSMQILGRGAAALTVRTRVEEAHKLLDGKFNIDLGGVRYISIVALQQPTELGGDSVSPVRISFNIQAERKGD